MTLVDIKKYKSLDIEKLVKAPWNYKEEDSKLSEKLIANIKRNGQVENLIVRKLDTGCYEIVNGNHRYDALVAIGAKKAIVHDLGAMSEVEAKRIAFETNETKFSTDKTKLSDLIDEIVKEFDMDDVLASMPFSEAEIERMVGASDEELKEPEFSAEPERQGSEVPFIVEGDCIELYVSDANFLKEFLLRYENRCSKKALHFECRIVAKDAEKEPKKSRKRGSKAQVLDGACEDFSDFVGGEEDYL